MRFSTDRELLDRARFPGRISLATTLSSLLVVICFVANGDVCAQETGALFSLSPASAPGMVLEAVAGGNVEGTAVSLGNPSDEARQKWRFIPKSDNVYVIKPSYSSNLVLAAQGGGESNGTPVVLAMENGKPEQLWSIKKNDNGSFSFIPQHDPDKSLDDFDGGRSVGSKQDIWDYDPDNVHVQWTLKPLEGASLPVVPVAPDDKVPKGTVQKFFFNSSTIYPGTTRECAVFIPAQYDGSQPACVLVQQDGYVAKVKTYLEQLIDAKAMPVTVGIFILPGYFPSPAKGMKDLRNRSYEYDGVSDKYVRFVTEEILPYVAKKFNLRLSTSGNDRCIVGTSSGGIAAFNAAWLRPDAFSRVYACSGSFAAYRGGNEFPGLIRQYEAKPLRIYLTTATRDVDNYAGCWLLLDQEIEQALKYSGYDYSFHVIEGDHIAGWLENYPDAMRFLWKGWPDPIPAGPSAPAVRDVIADNGKWEMAAQSYQDARGPACNSKGEIFFVDVGANKIYRIGLDGKTTVFQADAAHANSLSVGPHDELYTVSSSTGNIMTYDASGQAHSYASGIRGQYRVARPDGGVYVTTADPQAVEGSRIWLIKDGTKTLVDSGLKGATGLAYRPDQWLLSVADGRSKWVYCYQVEGDGRLINKEPYSWLHVPDWEDDAGPESICYAREGHLLVGTRLGIQICGIDGHTVAILPVPDGGRVIGVVLGGPDMHTLYAFCGDKVWKRNVKIHGIGAFSPPIPMN